jgi:hypothetical protein
MGDGSRHSGPWAPVFDDPEELAIFALFLEHTIREVPWGMIGLHMARRTISFSAHPVTESALTFAFVEDFAGCHDFGSSTPRVTKRRM